MMLDHPHALLAIDISPFWQSLALLPAMRALRAAYPRTFFTAAVGRGTSELLLAGNLVDETIDLGFIDQSSGLGSAIKRFAQVTSKARKRPFDLSLDFAPGPETQLIARLVLDARAVSPSGLSHMLDKILGRAGVARQPGDHLSDCENVLGQIGIKIADKRLGLEVPAEENARFEQLLSRHGSRGGEPVAVLHSSLAGGSRGWPVERFGELAVRLANNLQARIVAIDQPASDKFTEAAGSMIPRGAVKIASPRAYEMLAAVARASLVITDEPGLAQAALDLGAPALEVAERPAKGGDRFHRTVSGASRARIPVEEVYTVACQMIQESRSSYLFQR
jgi:ADP-heptose:LPS heptosyltransferase